ncbi:MAG: mammalian cell entry protein, partial [Pseudomonadota bacterium]
TSSVFAMERGIVGSTRLRAYTGVPTDPPLPPGAERTLLIGDVTAEIPLLLASVKELIENLSSLTAADSALSTSLSNLQELTEKFNGPHGAVGGLMGNEKDAQKLLATLDRATSVLTKVDGLLTKADTQIFGKDGNSQATIVQLNAMLSEARSSLKKVDAVLVDAQAISANAKIATSDLDMLRSDVDRSLRKVDQLVNEINRKWPFARDTELTLP